MVAWHVKILRSRSAPLPRTVLAGAAPAGASLTGTSPRGGKPWALQQLLASPVSTSPRGGKLLSWPLPPSHSPSDPERLLDLRLLLLVGPLLLALERLLGPDLEWEEDIIKALLAVNRKEIKIKTFFQDLITEAICLKLHYYNQILT